MRSKFDTEEYSQHEEAARKATDAASSRTPRANSFGFFAYSDAPGAIGGGIGMFRWFLSQKALLDHLADHLTYESPGQSDTDPFAVHAAVKSAVEKFKKSGASLETLIPKLNPLLRTYSHITWMGTLRDLKEGSRKYEKQLRHEFRESIESDEGTRPVRRFEVPEFLDF